jgi:hypothetical protein
MLASPALVEDETKTPHEIFGKGEFTRDDLWQSHWQWLFRVGGRRVVPAAQDRVQVFLEQIFHDVATGALSEFAFQAIANLGCQPVDGRGR